MYQGTTNWTGVTKNGDLKLYKYYCLYDLVSFMYIYRYIIYGNIEIQLPDPKNELGAYYYC